MPYMIGMVLLGCPKFQACSPPLHRSPQVGKNRTARQLINSLNQLGPTKELCNRPSSSLI